MISLLRCISFLVLMVTAQLGVRCDRRQPIPKGEHAPLAAQGFRVTIYADVADDAGNTI